MGEYKVLKRCEYSNNQNDYLLIKEFLFALKNDNKELLLKLMNNYYENLHYFKLKVSQYDSDGELIDTSFFECKNISCVPNQNFVPNSSLVLNNDCEDIFVEVVSAKYDKFKFDNTKAPVRENKIVEKEEVVDDFKITEVNDPVVKKDFFVNKRSIKLPKLFYILSSLIIIVASIISGVLVDRYKREHYVFDINDFTYEIVGGNEDDYEFSEDSEIILTSYKGIGVNINIPEKILNHTIVGIGDNAFANNRYIKKVNLPNNKDFTIGNQSFLNCEKLESVTFGGTVSIGDRAFYACGNLKSFESDYVNYIGESAFNTSGISKLIIKDSGVILNLEARTFNNCENLEDVVIESEVAWNDSNVYFLGGNDKITTLKLRKNYYEESESYSLGDFFGYDAVGLNYLTSIEFDTLKSIPDYFVYDNRYLEYLKIGDVIEKSVGSYAFMNCEHLKNIDYSFKDFYFVGDYSFFNTSIKEFDFSSITHLGENSFAYSDIEKVNLSNENFEGLTKGCFDNCTLLNEVTISTPIYSIPMSCFQNTKITGLNLNESSLISEVESYAFNGCTQLVNVDFINHCQVIGDYAFASCSSLEEATFGSELLIISSRSFSNCSSLKNVKLDDASNLSYIGDYAFNGCINLESFNFGALNALCTLANGVFKDCDSLKKVDMTTCNITEISEELFYGCNGLEEINLPGATSIIKNQAFKYCSSLKNIELSTNVTELGNSCFEGCTSLENFVISSNVKKLGSDLLKGCTGLITVELPFLGQTVTDTTSFTYIFGYNFNGNIEELKIDRARKIQESCFSNVKGIKKITIEGDINYLGDKAFYNSYFEEIEIKGIVHSMGTLLFSNCTNLKKLTIPTFSTNLYQENYWNSTPLNSLETLILTGTTIVESQQFGELKSLKYIEFKNDTLTTIRSNAFQSLVSLEEIVIPDSVISMDYSIFNNCSSLKKVTVPFIGSYDEYTFLFNSLFGYWSDDFVIPVEEISVTKANSLAMNCFENLPLLKKVTLPNTINNIPYGCFMNCYSLEEVIIPETVTYIDNRAFFNCISLNNIVLPQSLNNINYDAFRNCYSLLSVTNLSSINLNDNGIGFEDYLIEELKSLDEESKIVYHNVNDYQFVESPKGLVMIDYPIDQDTLTLPRSVLIGETTYNSYIINGGLFFNSSIKSISIPDFVTIINPLTFKDCKKLENILFGANSSLTTIGERAFENNESLLYFNNLFMSLNYIGYLAFNNCKNLLSVTLPANLTGIEGEAFAGCNNLFEVYNLSSLNIEIGSYDHGSVAYNALIIHKDISGEALKKYKDSKYEYAYSGNTCFIISYLGNETNVTLPNKIVIEGRTFTSYEIGPKAFYQKNIASLHISKAVTKIRPEAFAACTQLYSVTSDKDSILTEIGRSAFRECYNLRSFEMPNTVKKIGESAFQHNNLLESINLSKDLEFLGNYAFSYCHALSSITLYEKVNTIEYDCFYECKNLLEVYNLSSLNIELGSNDNGSCGYYALVIHKSLDEVPLIKHVEDGINYILLDGVGYITGYDNMNVPYDIKIPEELIVNGYKFDKFIIKSSAFQYYYGEQELIIPKSVIEINNNAFQGCGSLKKVIFEEGSPIEVLPQYCFSSCESLTYVQLPSNLKTIKENCFSYSSLYEIILPSTLKTIEYNAFYQCKKIIRIANNSSLVLSIGSMDNGCIAQYATSIEKDINEPLQCLETEYGLFVKYLDNWILVSYTNIYISPLELPSYVANGNIEIKEYVLGNYFMKSYMMNHMIVIPTTVNKIYRYAFAEMYNSYSLYYKGTKAEWDNIAEANYDNVYFYSSCAHEDNQWKYVNSTPVVSFPSINWYEETPTSCSQQGYKKGTCLVCNKDIQVTSPYLDHQLENGKCSVCNKSATQVTDGLFSKLFINDKTYPFGNNTTGFYSTNKDDNSSATISFIMNDDGIVYFEYTVSSEENCDCFIVSINNEQKGNVSGLNKSGNYQFNMKKGDILTLTYSKDGSAYGGNDCVIIENFQILENGG